MPITTEIVDQREIWNLPENLMDHSLWMSQEARRMGFPVTGHMCEIYEDAVILIPVCMRWDWFPGKIKMGRVISITRDGGYDVLSFVIMTEDGTQVDCMYGNAYPVHFALPEDTEDLFSIDGYPVAI